MLKFCFRLARLTMVLVAAKVAAVESVEVTPFAEGVWVHTSRQTVANWGLVPSNGVIVRTGEGLTVVDTAWGSESSRALLDWIDRELKLPVRELVVTHFHSDRLAGWEVFAERGARILVSEQTVALAKVAPTPAFDVYRLGLGERLARGPVEIFYPGPAHSPDNVVVWLPEAKILVGGCALRAQAAAGLGNLSDAVVPEWAQSMRRIEAAYGDVQKVLPGHGDAGGPELLRHTRELAAEAAVAKKK